MRKIIYRLAEKQLYVHGTTSKFLPTILSQGLVPRPKKKTGISWTTPYEGSYLSRTVSTAKDYAHEASIRHGGVPSYVFATIETRSPEVVADEDTLDRILTGNSADTVIEKLTQSFPDIPKKRWEARRDDIETYLKEIKHVSLSNFDDEQNKTRDTILKSLKDIASKSSEVRFKDRPIGYRGANKIIFVTKIETQHGEYVAQPVYGSSSEAMGLLGQAYHGLKRAA